MHNLDTLIFYKAFGGTPAYHWSTQTKWSYEQEVFPHEYWAWQKGTNFCLKPPGKFKLGGRQGSDGSHDSTTDRGKRIKTEHLITDFWTRSDTKLKFEVGREKNVHHSKLRLNAPI